MKKVNKEYPYIEYKTEKGLKYKRTKYLKYETSWTLVEEFKPLEEEVTKILYQNSFDTSYGLTIDYSKIQDVIHKLVAVHKKHTIRIPKDKELMEIAKKTSMIHSKEKYRFRALFNLKDLKKFAKKIKSTK